MVHDYEELFDLTISILRRRGVPHMFTGAIAVFVWGEPRYSEDVDIVLTARRAEASPVMGDLLRAGLLGPKPEEVFIQALYRVSMSRLAVDIWLRRSEEMLEHLEPHRRAEFRKEIQYGNVAFRRRVLQPYPARPRTKIWVTRPEDLIISKVQFSARDPARRYKDERDICAILLRQGRNIDRRYLVRWLRYLGLYRRFQAVEETCLPSTPRRRG